MAGLGKQFKGTGIAKIIKESRVGYKDGTDPKKDPIEEIKKSRNFSSPTDSTIQNDRDSQLQLKQKLESEINDKKNIDKKE
jgi:hypothetical protein